MRPVPASNRITHVAGRLTHLAGPAGRLEYLVAGRGVPCTVYGHGLGETINTTRPFGSGVAGRRVFVNFRGCGGSQWPDTPVRTAIDSAGQPSVGAHLCRPADSFVDLPGVAVHPETDAPGAPPPWTYQGLAEDLRAVADQEDATRALGVSMGAGALCALLADTPDRFERIVLALPAVIDRARQDGFGRRLIRLRELSQAADRDRITKQLLDEQPRDHRDRPEVRTWAAAHAQALTEPGSVHALSAMPELAPVSDRAVLGRVTAPVLVLGQEDDPAHPASVARELAACFEHAVIQVLPPGGVLWAHRDRLRRVISGFLN